MNYFKAAEQILSSVPALEQAAENLKRRQQRLIEGGAPREAGAINYNKPFTDTHYVSDTLSELLEISECSRNIAKNEAELSFIREIVDQLQDEHKQLIHIIENALPNGTRCSYHYNKRLPPARGALLHNFV